MDEFQLTTPVAFLIFNRPDTTARVFEAIRAARPPKLLVVADGPRVERQGEAERCAQTRAIVDGGVDWPCEVLRNYSDVNLGCKRRISSGLDWVFDTVEEAIILEDDCLPHATFFRYCSDLLDRYRDDDRIAMISGDNFQFGRRRTQYSYYFSRYPHIWGWATWRRTWKNYDVDMKDWPEVRDGGWLRDYFCRCGVAYFWHKHFESTYNGYVDTWDYQYTFACVKNSWLCIVSNHNLVSNIGFGPMAMRTKTKNRFAELATSAMEFPLRDPPYVMRDAVADRITENGQFNHGSVQRAVDAVRWMVGRR